MKKTNQKENRTEELEVTFTCGHVVKVKLYGDEKKRLQEIEDYQSRKCHKCHVSTFLPVKYQDKENSTKFNFLKKMSELCDKLLDNEIDPNDVFRMIERNLNIPDQEEWEIVSQELDKIGLKITDENSRYYGFNIYAYFNDYRDEGPKIEINIHNLSPFFVNIRAIDSYTNPQFDHDEYGKTYVDDEQLFEDHPNFNDYEDGKKTELMEEYKRENDNWEPSEFGKAETTVKEPEEIWTWLKEQVEKFQKEWEA